MYIVHKTCGWRGLQNTCVTQCLTPLVVEWGPVYIARLIRFKKHKHTTRNKSLAMWPSIPTTPGTCINPICNVPLYTEVRRISCTSSPLLSWSDLSCSPHKCVLVISLVNKANENPRLFPREADIFRSPRRRGRISVELVRSDRHGCLEAQDEQRLWLLTACGIKERHRRIKIRYQHLPKKIAKQK